MTISIFSIAAMNNKTYCMDDKTDELTLHEVNQDNKKDVCRFLSNRTDKIVLNKE